MRDPKCYKLHPVFGIHHELLSPQRTIGFQGLIQAIVLCYMIVSVYVWERSQEHLANELHCDIYLLVDLQELNLLWFCV